MLSPLDARNVRYCREGDLADERKGGMVAHLMEELGGRVSRTTARDALR